MRNRAGSVAKTVGWLTTGDRRRGMDEAAVRWCDFAPELILLCMRRYCRYGISYRDLEEMVAECGAAVDYTTLCCWVQGYAPEIKKRMLRHQNRLCRPLKINTDKNLAYGEATREKKEGQLPAYCQHR